MDAVKLIGLALWLALGTGAPAWATPYDIICTLTEARNSREAGARANVTRSVTTTLDVLPKAAVVGVANTEAGSFFGAYVPDDFFHIEEAVDGLLAKARGARRVRHAFAYGLQRGDGATENVITVTARFLRGEKLVRRAATWNLETSPGGSIFDGGDALACEVCDPRAPSPACTGEGRAGP